MKLCIISFTENGIKLSEKIAGKLAKWEGEVKLFAKNKAYEGKGDENGRGAASVNVPVSDWAGEQMRERNAMLFIGACGIAVRAVAPHLRDKLHDSPVLVIDEKGRYVIPILSGHVGGANELAVFLAKEIGGEPVITTATDINGRFAVDMFAKKNGLFIVNKEGIGKVSSRVLEGEEITISIEPGCERALSWGDRDEPGRGDEPWQEGEPLCMDRPPAGVNVVPYPPNFAVDILISSWKAEDKERERDAALLLKPREYAIGIGCKKGKTEEEIERLVTNKIKELGISVMQIGAVASIARKKDEAGIVLWCRKEGIPFFTYTAKELQEVKGDFTKSAFVKDKMGVDNVCERAAVKACGRGGKLVAGKYAKEGMTIAVAKKDWSCIYIVGMGPGKEEMMTGESLRVLEQSDVIVGYTRYLELLGERFRRKELLSTPMRQEKERCEICFREAEKGKKVALICSGDAGIYGMASLMYEIGQNYPEIELFVIPGVTAASSGAAVLGAPLNHDFCVISLSDLLTPWKKIEKRLEAAAKGDFAIAIYNPSSHKRKDYLKRACQVLLHEIEGERVCGYVENIGREGTKAQICTLNELKDREVNMFTTVFIGNSDSRLINGKLVTKRGYQI